MPRYDDDYLAREKTLIAQGVDPHGQVDTVLGVAFVHCHAHCRPHRTGWCTVSVADKTPLAAATETEALAESRALGFWVYGDPRPCSKCGTSIDQNSLGDADAPVGERTFQCSEGGTHRP
jgi:hypothetical protein